MADTTPIPTLGTMPEVYLGSYRLLRPMGNGGMSSVFRAVHAETGVEVALKVLPRTLAQSPTLLQRFLREAKSAESLQHSNIVEIYDRGEDQGRHYLVLELVDGGDLHERVRSVGRLTAAEAIRVVRATALGLDYAATRGVIHRDVKPANILMDGQGRVKVTDLGLALQVDEEDERVTRDGTTVGTVDYMSPEQARDSRATSIRSDIYSLGCTLYYLLTGFAPFAGGDLPSKLRRHAVEAPPDVRQVRPELSPALSRLIQRMMAKSPAARFADYAQLVQTLDALPISDLDQDGDPQLVPLDDDLDDSSSLRPGNPSASGRADSSELTGSKHPGGSRLSPAGSRVPAAGSRVAAAEVFKAAATKVPDAAPLLRQILEEEVHPHLPPPSLGGRRGSETSVQDYIIRGIVVGLAIAVTGLATTQVARLLARTSPARPVRPEIATPEPPIEADPTPVPKPEFPPDDTIFIPESPSEAGR